MYKIAKYGAFAFGIVGVILWITLWLSDDIKPENGTMQALFVLTYVLLGISLVAVIVSAAQNILASPQALKKTLIYTGAFVVIVALSYVFSSGESQSSIDAVATDSVRKWVGAGLIALYILVAVAIVALVASNVKKALMK